MGVGNGGYCGAAGLGWRMEAPNRDWGPKLRSAAGFVARLQGCDRIMCEGPSSISGPIPPDPTLCPDYYRRPASGELRGPTAWRVARAATEHGFPPRLALQPKGAWKETH